PPGAPGAGEPDRNTVPWVGGRPARMRTNVDLPDPLGPTTAVIVPARTVSDTPVRASAAAPGYRNRTSRNVTGTGPTRRSLSSAAMDAATGAARAASGGGPTAVVSRRMAGA